MSKRPRDAPRPPQALAPPPAGADAPSLFCPTCAFHLRAAPSPYAPSTFDGCGHSLCGQCVDTVTLAPAPHCPVCQAEVKAHAVNVALGELGEAVWGAAQPAPAVPLSNCSDCAREATEAAEAGEEAPPVHPGHLKCSKCPKVLCLEHAGAHTKARPVHVMEGGEGPAAARASNRCLAHTDTPLSHFCVSDSTVICAMCVLEGHAGHECVTVASGWCEARLQERAARLTPAAEAMMRGVAAVEDVKAALGIAKDAAIKQIEAEMDALFVRLFAYGADMVKRVEVVYDERVKALEAQAEGLAVTSAQLRAAAEVAARALSLPQPSALDVARACACVCAVGRLAGDCPAPAATAILRVECEPAPLLAALDSLLTLVVDNSRELAAQARQEAERIAAEELAAAEEARKKAEALPRSLIPGSAILATVAPERVAAFLRELSAWLPRRAYTLLYRGSRDGMTAAAFHGLCDGKGPTLVLVRCDKGWVFGGHAGSSWESSVYGEIVSRSDDAFLFSVTGPYTDTPVRFPVKADRAHEALWGDASCGPCFSGGLIVDAVGRAPTACFGSMCRCWIGESWSSFDDVIGRGNDSLTGAEDFVPTDIEVYSITRV